MQVLGVIQSSEWLKRSFMADLPRLSPLGAAPRRKVRWWCLLLEIMGMESHFLLSPCEFCEAAVL